MHLTTNNSRSHSACLGGMVINHNATTEGRTGQHRQSRCRLLWRCCHGDLYLHRVACVVSREDMLYSNRHHLTAQSGAMRPPPSSRIFRRLGGAPSDRKAPLERDLGKISKTPLNISESPPHPRGRVLCSAVNENGESF